MSLLKPHPILTTAGSNPYQVTMSIIQSIMISGRYRTELLCSNWSQNVSGFCLLPSCQGLQVVEDLHHVLANCMSLEPTRQQLIAFTLEYVGPYPDLLELVRFFLNDRGPLFTQFLVDCSTLPQVICAAQLYGSEVLHHLFRVTRTWCFSLHKKRVQFLDRRCLYWVKLSDTRNLVKITNTKVLKSRNFSIRRLWLIAYWNKE